MLVGATMVMLVLAACGERRSADAEPKTGPAIELATIDSALVAVISARGSYASVGTTIGTLMSWLGKRQVMPVGPPYTVYFDDPAKTAPESARYEVGIPVPAGTIGDAEVNVKIMGPFLAATTVHVGAYESLGQTYGKLMRWIADGDYEIVGAPHEFYITTPGAVPFDSLKTKIAVPVKPKR